MARTSRTGDWIGPASARRWAPPAGRARGRSRPTTRTPRRWASRRRGARWRPTPQPSSRRSCSSPPRRPYLDKTNATAIHAALGLPQRRRRLRRASARCARARPRCAHAAPGTLRSCVADVRTGLPGGADEAHGGDGAAAFLFGDGGARDRRGDRLGSATGEFLDRWRVPGEPCSPPVGGALRRAVYVPLAEAAFDRRAQGGRRHAGGRRPPRRRRPARPGRTGAGLARRAAEARPRRPRPSATPARPRRRRGAGRRARPGRAGRDHRRGSSSGRRRRRRRCCAPPTRSRSHRRGHHRAAADRGGPRRPSLRHVPHLARPPDPRAAPPARPERPAAPPSLRHEAWKFGFVASRCTECGTRHLPPARVCVGATPSTRWCPSGWPTCRPRSRPSPSTGWPTRCRPPVVAAVVDFDGGGRFRCELTDVDPATVAIGDRVEMTFRRLFTAGRRPQLLLEGAARAGRSEQLMASNGIRDRVAIVGMGCTPFGEHWDKSVDDLLIDATSEALGIGRRRARRHRRVLARHDGLGRQRPHPVAAAEARLQAGHPRSRTSAPPAPRRSATPATRWPPAPTTWSMAIGVEKLKDSGFSGPRRRRRRRRRDAARRSPRRPCSPCSPRPTPRSTASTRTELKDVLTRIAWKNHHNGALNPRAQFRKEVRKETICSSPAGRRPARHLRLLGRVATARPPPSSCGPRTPTATPTSRST